MCCNLSCCCFKFYRKFFAKNVKNKVCNENDDLQLQQSSLLTSPTECSEKSPILSLPNHQFTQIDDAKPKILDGARHISVILGDTMCITVRFVSSSNTLVQWTKRDRLLTSNADPRITVETTNCETRLMINEVMQDDSGKYSVTVNNDSGSTSHSLSVDVKSAPEAPFRNPEVKQIAPNTLSVSWNQANFDGGSVVTSYLIEMRSTENSNWSLVCRSKELFCQVSDLNTNVGYVFRVKAENKFGISEPSLESDVFYLRPVRGEQGAESNAETLKMDTEQRMVSIEEGSKFKDFYNVENEIGRGRFGVVYLCTNKQSNAKRAAKFVRCIREKDKEQIREEIEIMNRLRHPKLLQLECAYQMRKEIVLVMEYIPGGELFERIIADDFILTENDCIEYIRQILEGVHYMHQNYVMHLDLKPENIVCQTKTGHTIKIIDFGLARLWDPKKEIKVLMGTPEFVAPEVIQYEAITPKADLWSIGVICYVLLSGLSPFASDSDSETFSNVIKVQYDFEDEAFDNISAAAKDFISRLLCKKPEKRLSAAECISHQWLSRDEKLVTRANVQLPTDKLKKFYYRRKWQKSGNAIRALGRLAIGRMNHEQSCDARQQQSADR
ncbi:myosin light chain kinase: smooth muscle-like protein [Dinothrombium tinctorium]|uniref:Myosin light chain kinase: smooth muscle-like protein n=1 Tax=Dinothrombium tinctorium TaxID=1965070 RepID=A0A443RN52_9ACAR|nr:myosin light chain kinase: smooth muscle-like protein [Dinothrombium tinctorium]